MAYEKITIPAVELFETGTHNGDHYDLSDLEEMAKNSTIIKMKPIVKLGHGTKQEFEGPSLGYVDRLRVVGNKLVGDLVDVPKKLGELIRSGAYGRARSAEIYENFRDSAGKLYRFVFRAISLLGETWPAVTNLKPITNLDAVESLYSRSLTSGLCYDEHGAVYKRYDLTKRRKPAEVNYRQGDKDTGYCAMCSHYSVREDACTMLDSEVSAAAFCDLFDKWDPQKGYSKQYSIKKVGAEYHVTTKSGLTLGAHDTLEGAERQRKELAAK